MANDEEPLSEFDRHANDESWFDEGDEVYENMLDQLQEDYPEEMDQYAADLMYSGWFDPDVTSFDRVMFQFEFFDYTGIEYNDFDWDTWREWYES